MANDSYGSIYIIGEDANGKRVVTMTRTSDNPSADEHLCSKALEFRDAAKRDGRTFVCAILPKSKWNRMLLNLIGVKDRDIVEGTQ